MVEEAKKETATNLAAVGQSEAAKEEKKIGKFIHGDHMIHILF